MPESRLKPSADTLYVPLGDASLGLEKLVEGHRADLRRACAADENIWPIYSSSFDPAHFDASFDTLLAGERMSYAVISDGALVGMTAWLRPDWDAETIEIGQSYLHPDVRGSGLNGRLKRLMMGHAFGVGIRRIEFRIDERNQRSQAAVRKLGCTKEGVLRQQKITWTGHVRDVGLWSFLASEAAKLTKGGGTP
ncbi:MAG TPA: GNAT family protein [Sphingopyxis sp.]|nr:GNAT family protein [Sphingopyxis sp.]